jgi:hypothetical protein
MKKNTLPGRVEFHGCTFEMLSSLSNLCIKNSGNIFPDNIKFNVYYGTGHYLAKIRHIIGIWDNGYLKGFFPGIYNSKADPVN